MNHEPSRTLGTVGLVCGILSIFPFGALAGIPAVIVSVLALVKEPGARGRSIAGAVLGVVGIFMTAGLALTLAILIGRARDSRPAVADTEPLTLTMYSVSGSLDEWAETNGTYPAPEDFSSDSSRFMVFLARDRVG